MLAASVVVAVEARLAVLGHLAGVAAEVHPVAAVQDLVVAEQDLVAAVAAAGNLFADEVIQRGIE